MARSLQLFAIIISITACVLGYLFYLPPAEGVTQLNRIRVISALMKTFKFIVIVENFRETLRKVSVAS